MSQLILGLISSKDPLTRRWLRIKKAIKDLAIQRVRILYEEALLATRRGDLELARRYVELANRITERVNVRRPKYLRRGTCKKCLIPLIPGLTARFRVKGVRKYVIISCTCLLCGWVRRFPCRRVGS